MAAMLRAASRVGRPLCASVRPQQAVRYIGIKILEEKGKAQESLYWAQEDERLLKKMIE
eukprot:CAMPEP_0179238568 /NCGR_PEP_ID=MMETSP0797-20121207/15013_1 /TAXON_ID=47934 /ORGANISM="Dinophysis acuminata, Strain DAEP01" /LENGTH=58 /DNA_ID=CAMNT_0020945865 /DNA_START=62 /DNA_END=235 /DNA_ORIENTATION=+